MNLGSNMLVVGVVVQSGGSGDPYPYSATGWMTSYSVEYSYYENSGFVSVKNQATNNEMFYTKDIGDSPDCIAQYGFMSTFCSLRRSSGIFAAPIFAQYVKITIRGQQGSMALRAGVLIMYPFQQLTAQQCKLCLTRWIPLCVLLVKDCARLLL